MAALYQTIPLWTILFSYLYLKEKPNAAQGVAATLALTGAMLIARPTFVRQAIGAADQGGSRQRPRWTRVRSCS